MNEMSDDENEIYLKQNFKKISQQKQSSLALNKKKRTLIYVKRNHDNDNNK